MANWKELTREPSGQRVLLNLDKAEAVLWDESNSSTVISFPSGQDWRVKERLSIHDLQGSVVRMGTP